MKTNASLLLLVLLIILGLLPVDGKAQLIVYAGEDTTFCTGQYIDSLKLGTNAKIENSVAPFTIAWECKIPKGTDEFFTASDLLNDTTILTTYFLYNPNHTEWIKFTLHVTDAEGNNAKDSLFIRFSKFGYLTGGSETYFLQKGDSIQVQFNSNTIAIGGGIQPLEYHWQPKTGLTDPESSETWCKPDSSIQYSAIAIDSCGCVSYPAQIYDIRVFTTGLDEITAEKHNALNIRQNGTKLFFNNPLKLKAHITLYSTNGEAIHSFNTIDDHFEISHFLDIQGIFIVKISVGKQTGSGKIIKH